MHFSILAITTFLASINASPVAEPAANPAPGFSPIEAAPAGGSDILTKRSIVCTINGTGVNCRNTPSLSGSVKYVFNGGETDFSCDRYVSGQCSGGNCYWDYTPTYGCWVNARYTGSNCNPNTLPSC